MSKDESPAVALASDAFAEIWTRVTGEEVPLWDAETFRVPSTMAADILEQIVLHMPSAPSTDWFDCWVTDLWVAHEFIRRYGEEVLPDDWVAPLHVLQASGVTLQVMEVAFGAVLWEAVEPGLFVESEDLDPDFAVEFLAWHHHLPVTEVFNRWVQCCGDRELAEVVEVWGATGWPVTPLYNPLCFEDARNLWEWSQSNRPEDVIDDVETLCERDDDVLSTPPEVLMELIGRLARPSPSRTVRGRRPSLEANEVSSVLGRLVDAVVG